MLGHRSDEVTSLGVAASTLVGHGSTVRSGCAM